MIELILFQFYHIIYKKTKKRMFLNILSNLSKS